MKMENKWAFGIGMLLAFLGAAYAIYKLFFKHNTNSVADSGDILDSPNITYTDEVDYEMLYSWLKSEYKKPDNAIIEGCKFGIMPSSIAKKTYTEVYNKEFVLQDGQDVLCVFIIDEQEENVLVNQYFVYKEMKQSLKDMLNSNNVVMQDLKK